MMNDERNDVGARAPALCKTGQAQNQRQLRKMGAAVRAETLRALHERLIGF
jgi:hypothetical protein